MPKDIIENKAKAQYKARKVYDEAIYRAFKFHIEPAKQAGIDYQEALKKTTDARAKQDAEAIYSEVLNRAKKVRDEAMDEAQQAFTAACK